MKTFPMFLKMTGRRVVILGGGEEAAQKARLIAKTEADLVIAAPALCAELSDLVRTGKAWHHAGPVSGDLFQNTPLAFAASGCSGADAAQAAIAGDAGVLVNAVDYPDICDAYTPSIVDRDPVVIAIGTEGTAPVLARQLKTRIEEMVEPALGQLAALAGRLRPKVAQHLPRERHRSFWAWVFSGAPRRASTQGDIAAAARMVGDALSDPAGCGSGSGGSVSLVGAGPGARDLITLRGVKRLQEADVILYDRLISTDVLELARRDAQRICVGKAPGDACLPERWSQGRINRLIVKLGREGKHVVRLKSGDPGIFGRAEEELEACRAAQIPCEVVPGVTAASGAAAELGECLTKRGSVDSLTVVTATDHTHNVPKALGETLHPGTRMAIYMGIRKAGEVQDTLLRHAPADLPVTIVENATCATSIRHETTLGQMARHVRDHAVKSPAIVFVTHAKDRKAHAANEDPAWRASAV